MKNEQNNMSFGKNKMFIEEDQDTIPSYYNTLSLKYIASLVSVESPKIMRVNLLANP